MYMKNIFDINIVENYIISTLNYKLVNSRKLIQTNFNENIKYNIYTNNNCKIYTTYRNNILSDLIAYDENANNISDNIIKCLNRKNIINNILR